jgi:hypothetical protein
MELYAAEEWDGAADALTSLVDPSVDSLPLRRRLGALFRADRRRDTTDLLDSLAPDVAAMPFYRRAAAVLAHRAGNWERVREHAEAYLRDVPDDLELRLIWIEAVEGLGDNATVTAFLDGPLMFPAASARHRMILAHALDRHGRGDRSLLLAYQTLRLHRADPDAHKGYFGLLFMGRAAPNAVPKPQTIGPDVAFEVKDDRGELRWYVIETATLPPLDPTRGEIGPVSALADRAFGLRVGDKVRISEAELQIDEREIVAIKHKYLHGLHRSIEDFNSVFPSDQALQKFHVDAARPESLKKTMLPALQARREHGEQIIERYKNDAWPIALMGAALGVGAIEAWHGLQEDAVEIRTCRGTGPERERALSRLSAKPSLAIDPLTLWIAEKLKVADALVQTFGLLGVAASTLTVFDELLQDRDGGRTRRAGVAFEVGGELVFRRETAADTKRAIRDLSEIRAAVRRHTVLIPTIPAREVSPVLRAVDGKLATNLTDPIFAASGADRVLLSDDERLRQIAVQEVSVPSVWLQAALMVARDVGSLDPTRYCDAVLALAASRHAFTSLDASTLLRAAARSGWSDAQRFRKIAASLGGATIDLRSALGVAAEFLRTLWTTNIGTTAQRRFTVAIVEVLCSGRDIATQAKMVEVLRRSGPSLSDFNAMKAFDAAMSSLTRA